MKKYYEWFVRTKLNGRLKRLKDVLDSKEREKWEYKIITLQFVDEDAAEKALCEVFEGGNGEYFNQFGPFILLPVYERQP